MDRRSLLLRVLTAVVGIPLLLGAAWLGDPWWGALVAILCVLGALEYGRLLGWETSFSVVLGVVFVAPTVFILSRPDLQLFSVWIVGIGGTLLFALAFLPPVLSRNPQRGGLMKLTGGPAIVGWLYLAVTGGALAELGTGAGFFVLLWFFVTIWANDIAAYFAGHAVGRHRLAPQVSPGKSWEGAIFGLFTGTVIGWVIAAGLPITSPQAVVASAVVILAAQLGDLFESAMKRRAGVKDSGVIFPGHGGVLDRFDGVFAAAPVAYLLLQWWAH